MTMSEGEIVRNYQYASNRSGQIQILAQLNCTTPGTIKEILKKHGCDVPIIMKTTYVPAAVYCAVQERMHKLESSTVSENNPLYAEMQKEYTELDKWIKSVSIRHKENKRHE